MSLATSGKLSSRARLCALCLVVTTGCGDTSAAHQVGDARLDGPEPAPGRRALAVIADFSGARLEDWGGAGFHEVAQVRAQLDEMTAHWRFLRRGLETIGWTIVRVQMPQQISAGAFASAADFCDAVMRLARRQIDDADYDFDGDGTIDTVWIIASSHGQTYGWLAGGPTRSGGANVFVDAQDDARVRGGLTGDFNHDVARTRGVPDLHGAIDNVGDLSLMASSAVQPPNDFSAYDRLHLGWLTPRMVGPGVSTIDVPDANQALVAFAVPTAQPDEYFLLEYRRRPAMGYASAGSIPTDGVVVYHVLESSDQTQDPPLLRVEAILAPGAAPVSLRTYGGAPVFSLDAVRTGPAGSLEADLTVLDIAR